MVSPLRRYAVLDYDREKRENSRVIQVQAQVQTHPTTSSMKFLSMFNKLLNETKKIEKGKENGNFST
jgi:hypothetical protein